MLEELRVLLDKYEEGLFTEEETISVALNIMFKYTNQGDVK